MQQGKIDNYRSERGAQAYQRDHETKLHRKVSTQLELRILGQIFADLARQQPIERVLDLPCGTGRLLPFLRDFWPFCPRPAVLPRLPPFLRDDADEVVEP